MILAMASRISVLGAGVVAVVCCAGLPAIGAALGGITATVLVGVAAGLFTALLLGAAAVAFVRRRYQRRRTEARR